MSTSRYEQLEQRGEPTRAFGRQAARRQGQQRNPYPYGTRKYWLWQEGYNAERQAQRRVATPDEPARRRPVPESRRRPASKQSLAQLAGALCNNPAFQEWCGASDAESAAAWLRATCGIQSRRELDTSPVAAVTFHMRVRRPFAASRE